MRFISKNEWHPFTITSAPDEEFVSVHINAVGNWTTAITTLLNPDKKIGIVQEDLLKSPYPHLSCSLSSSPTTFIFLHPPLCYLSVTNAAMALIFYVLMVPLVLLLRRYDQLINPLFFFYFYLYFHYFWSCS